MNMADKIIALRKSRGISQDELAEKLNVSRQAVSRWETGAAMPDAMNILQLSRLFQVTADYLLNDDYSSDSDLPQVKQAKAGSFEQIMVMLITLEVMAVILQFMCMVILQNLVFTILSFIPMAALIGGFEYTCRKKGVNDEVRHFRRRFYSASAWLGLYFPVRLITLAATSLYPRPYSSLALECVILVVYLMAVMLVRLEIQKRSLPKE
ncbi:MAG: helix-turn-helix transcriptional regulator [Clostridia bacterium]|nr:helix-turn-helix transcriptional regulator [Clostridia bacterium]